MKKPLLTRGIAFLLFSFYFTYTYAQFWKPLIPVLEQWSVQDLNLMNQEIQNLQNVFDVKNLNLRDANDGLQDQLREGDPMQDLNEFSSVFGDIREGLGDDLDGLNARDEFEMSNADIKAVLDEYDRMINICDRNIGDLGQALDLYREDLLFDPDAIDDGFTGFGNSTGKWEESFNLNKWRTGDIHERYAQGDKHGSNMKKILENLLDASYDLEMSFGTFTGGRQFWWFSYPVDARAFRIATVPDFKNSWGTRWSINAAFFRESDLQGNSETINPADKILPLMYNADYAVLYNPKLAGSNNGLSLKLYTSVGMELGVYAPGYIIPDLEDTYDNVGKTTGIGPQIGAGVIIDAGFLTFYSYGTMSQGAIKNAPNYRYESYAANAGVRLNKLVNVMYTRGYANWGFGDHGEDSKFIDYNRFTVGLILSEIKFTRRRVGTQKLPVNR